MEYKIIDGVLKICEDGTFYNLIKNKEILVNLDPHDKTYKRRVFQINKKIYRCINEFYKAFVGDLQEGEPVYFVLKDKSKPTDKHNLVAIKGFRPLEENIKIDLKTRDFGVRPYSFKAFDTKGDLIHETKSMVEMGKILNLDVMEMLKVTNKNINLNGYYFFKKYINDNSKA